MIEIDSNGKPILRGAHESFMVRKIHNVMVVQSRENWTVADVQKAIKDAKAGIVYDRA